MTDFEKTLLEKVDKMNESLSLMAERLTVFEGETKTALTELSGKIKGNHELIVKDLSSYTDKDMCANYREHHGERVGDIEERVIRLELTLSNLLKSEEDKHHNASDRITAWLPSIIALIAVIGGIIWMAIK